MLIKRAHKVELKPNKAQICYFVKACGIARFTYNYALGLHDKHYKETGKHLSAIDTCKQLCAEKKAKYPWMYEVTKCAPQIAVFNVETAFIRFFKKQGGYPKFKKKGKSRDSFGLDNTAFNESKIKGNHVIIPNLGPVRVKELLKIEGKILSATISREADRWFLSALQEVEIGAPTKPTGKPVGIDLGVKSLIVTSDGESIQTFKLPYDLKTEEKRIKKEQQKLSRKQKGSNNRKKQVVRVARAHRKLRNKRKDAIHKATTILAKTKSVIVMEDLNTKGMVKNHCIARVVSNAAFGEIKRQLEYKTKWYGSELIFVSRWFPSSKKCNKCGFIKKDLVLDDRDWTCPECGEVHERDENAALNILVEGLSKNTVSHTGIYACGDRSSFVDSSTSQPVDEARINDDPGDQHAILHVEQMGIVL
jgi:putative transposase